jgi:hypothetical protein
MSSSWGPGSNAAIDELRDAVGPIGDQRLLVMPVS